MKLNKHIVGGFHKRLYRFIFIVFCLSILGLYVLTDSIPQKSTALAQANKLPLSNLTPNYTPIFPDSNVEWFDMWKNHYIGDINQFIVTWKIRGKITKISDKTGRIGGLKYYYTGEKGYFTYFGQFTLIGDNGHIQTISLSKKRMEMLEVYKNTPGGIEKATFNDIKVGDNIEIEESVDLVLPNINDENLRYLTIRIL